MDWIYYIALILVLVVGFAINLMTLPGLWVMLAGLVGYALVTGWGVHVGWAGVATVLILVLLPEAAEMLMGGAAAKKAGGSTRAGVGAMIGGLLGALFLTPPLWLIGTVIGACLGAFVGALVAEFTVRGDPMHSTRVGYAAAIGRFIGILTKMVFGIIILLVAGIIAMPPIWSRAPVKPAATVPTTVPAPVPATMPATAPVTTMPAEG